MDRLDEFRTNKDEFFGRSPHSPLPGRTAFTGLDYYSESDDLSFALEVKPAAGGDIEVEASDGARRRYQRAGVVNFLVDGSRAELTFYSTGNPGYFIPFRDATSGSETYGAGRYLDVEPNEDGTVTIDFNYVYNPYCAYNETYSCPLPPVENWMRVPIRAGEKTYPPA